MIGAGGDDVHAVPISRSHLGSKGIIITEKKMLCSGEA
jgi:hypothetical protein